MRTPLNALIGTLLVVALSAGGSAAAQKAPSKALVEDARTYAERHRVSLDEAVRRLGIQSIAGEIEPQLAKEPSFAGLWLEHQPKFRVVASFTDRAAAKRVLPGVDALRGELEIRPARWTLAELEQHQAQAIARSNLLGFVVESGIDLRQNRVEIFVVEDRATSGLRDAQRELGPSVVVIGVEQLSQPAVDGGENISSCTGGFTVKTTGTDEYGILTAAHCSNSQTADGFALPFRNEDQSGNQDVQWNSTCDIVDVSDNFNSGIGMRDVSGTRSRANQVVGAQVCKYGVTTGRTCANIDTKNRSVWWVTNSASTFIDVDDPAFIDGGDSGGPVFVENTAYGIAIGTGGTYMAIDYISSLGVEVLTSDPSFDCEICTLGVCGGDEPCCSGTTCLPSGLGGLFTCQ